MNQEIFKRDIYTDSRSSLRHFQVAKAGAEFGRGNYYVTHIYEVNYRRYEKASSVQISFASRSEVEVCINTSSENNRVSGVTYMKFTVGGVVAEPFHFSNDLRPTSFCG